jgi:uncharacterized protein
LRLCDDVAMKILCVADETDPLVYSQNIAERFGNVDFVIGAGDLRLRYYEYIVSTLNKPLYFVFGNHHVEELEMFHRRNYFEGTDFFETDKRKFSWGIGADYLDGKVLRDKNTGLLLAGLGGCMRYNNGEHQFTEKQMLFRILRMIPKLLWNKLRRGRFLDILVTHAPPRGIGDAPDQCHTGFMVFLWFMRRFKPRYVLHGHIHLIDLNAQRVHNYYDTQVINVFGSYVLEVENTK